MGTHPSQDRRHEIGLFVQGIGLIIFALRDQGDISRDICVGRTRVPAFDVSLEPIGICFLDSISLVTHATFS
jgi:hypothetical protein